MSCILGMQNVNTTRMDAEKNFKTIIELFKKSFLESLHEVSECFLTGKP